MPESDQHGKDGLPGDLLDVCVLLQHEVETAA
jgi:hypothetical protein